MPKTHTKTIKGLGIATAILASLAIVGCLLSMGFLAAMEPYLSGAIREMDYHDGGYYSYSDTAIVAQLISAAGAAIGALGAVLSIVILIAGIISIRCGDQPHKLGLVFGWALAGAIISFLSMSITTLVLLILIAVFAYKDKKLYLEGRYPLTPEQAAAYGVVAVSVNVEEQPNTSTELLP